MALKTRTIHTPAVVGGDAKLEKWLDSKGVTWEFYPRLDVDQFDLDKSLHNQARFEPIDDQRVDSYTEAMKRGDQFPPVIAHGKLGKLIMADGNQPPAPAPLAHTDYPPFDPTGSGVDPGERSCVQLREVARCYDTCDRCVVATAALLVPALGVLSRARAGTKR